MKPEDDQKFESFLSELDKLGTNLEIIAKEIRKKKLQSLESTLFILLLQVIYYFVVILAVSYNNYILRIIVGVFSLLYLIIYLYLTINNLKEYHELKKES